MTESATVTPLVGYLVPVVIHAPEGTPAQVVHAALEHSLGRADLLPPGADIHLGEAKPMAWPRTDNLDGSDEVTDAEAETARVVGEGILAMLRAAGIRVRDGDPLLGQQTEHPAYFYGGGDAPNGTPLTIAVNVTP